MKRRKFLKTGFSISLLPLMNYACTAENSRQLKILILGGTNFVGPAIVNAAIENGHQLTLFNRGVTNPELFPNIPKIKGDREKNNPYDALKGKEWNVVIDVWPEKSSLVAQATEALKNQTKHYLFISSIAVYNDFNFVGLQEESPLVRLPDDPAKWYYSEEKAAAEKIVAERFPGNHTILRPGPIKGWRDPANDLAYWLKKIKRGEEILAPGTGNDPIQFIDVKDLGQFAVKAAEEKLNGVYNVTGPRTEPLLWKEFLDICRTSLNAKTQITWASEAFLAKNQVRSFEDIPLWAPLSEDAGFMQISAAKANQAGFVYRPIRETLKDTLEWFEKNHAENYPFGLRHESVGLDRERELALLDAWKVESVNRNAPD